MAHITTVARHAMPTENPKRTAWHASKNVMGIKSDIIVDVFAFVNEQRSRSDETEIRELVEGTV